MMIFQSWSNDNSDITTTLTSLNNDFDLDLPTQVEFDSAYGLLPADETIIIRAYSDDTDDRMLADIQPRFVIMFEPCVEFIRRIEVRICVDSRDNCGFFLMIYAGLSKLVGWSCSTGISYGICEFV
jgi:DNA excision repair protein ERCC-4